MYLLDKNLLPDAVVKPAIFTPDLAGLIAWLETQQGETTYDYTSPDDCLICRFGSVLAGKRVKFSRACELVDSYGLGQSRLQLAAYGEIWGAPETSFENTYSGALLRARAILGAA